MKNILLFRCILFSLLFGNIFFNSCTKQPNISETSGLDSEEELTEELPERKGKAQDIKMSLVTDPMGRVITVIGHYDLGLDKHSFKSPSKVTEAILKFILNDKKQFGLLEGDKLKLLIDSFETVDGYTTMAKVHQYVGDLKVIDSELSVSFAEDGFFQSINGLAVPNRMPKAQVSLQFQSILKILKNDTSAYSKGSLEEFKLDGKKIYRRKDNATILPGWSRKFDRPVWIATLPEEIIVIDDNGGKIIQRYSQRRFGPISNCKVRHRNWPRASDGRATSLAESSSATRVAEIKCEAEESWGRCKWRLQRQPFGFKHGIARILDENGSEKEINQDCESSNTPSFNAENGDALREQGAYYVAHQMRSYIKQNVWDQVSPNRDANLDIHLDDNTVLDDKGNPSAFFNGFWTEIKAHQSRGEQEVIMHEYGHYVVWTYDDVSFNCEQGLDEGSSLNETLANVFAGIFALDNNKINPRYGAYSGLVGAPIPHMDATSLLLHDANCSQGDPHGLGEAFEQAVWELLFNQDATIEVCNSSTGHGDKIWINTSRENVIRHVGSALGFALKILGQNITHSQVAEQMVVKIGLDSGSTTANRARSIFIHHGVL